jgi:hypothetical protein
MNKLDALTTGLAAAITFAVLYSICALAFALFPDGTLAFLNAWFHGMDLGLLRPAGGEVWTVGDFLYGLLGVSVTAFVAGFLFALVSNFLKR